MNRTVIHLTKDACKHPEAWAWQSEANADRKVAAIKTLRSSMGYGLKEAKDVVEEWYANRYRYADIVPTNDECWILPGTAPGVERRVTQHADGTFTLEVVETKRFHNLGLLLAEFVK
jgi:Ribosomal protein L7/L12 C-terminal domain